MSTHQFALLGKCLCKYNIMWVFGSPILIDTWVNLLPKVQYSMQQSFGCFFSMLVYFMACFLGSSTALSC